MQLITSDKNQFIKKVLFKPNWYVLYTRHRHEKKVFERLQQMKIDSYLPQHTTIRRWSDRKKKVTEPLFSCYVFVNITAKEYYNVLNIPGVLRYVAFEGKAVAIPEKQIQLIKKILKHNITIDGILDTVHLGSRVEIKAGPLTGIIGELVEYIGKKRVIIRIEEIYKSILINVPLYYLRSVG